MGRTNSIASASSVSHHSQHHHHQNYSSIPYSTPTPQGAPQTPTSSASDRSRQRSRISRLSQSQPGSRSNSPSSKFAYATYNSPYGQAHLQQQQQQQYPTQENTPLSLVSPPGRAGRRFSATSSASSSRDTSPTGRFGGGPKFRSRSVSQSPQVLFNPNSSTAKLLLASREAEATLGGGGVVDGGGGGYKSPRGGPDISMGDYDYGGGNHSDSEDSYTSRTSNRSYLSEFSPTSSGRSHMYTDDVEELLTKCGSAKWSERKEGLLGLQSYLTRHGALPQKYLNKIGKLTAT